MTFFYVGLLFVFALLLYRAHRIRELRANLKRLNARYNMAKSEVQKAAIKRCRKRGHTWHSVNHQGKLVNASDPNRVGKVCMCGAWDE